MAEKVEASLDNFGVADRNLHSFSQSLRDPRLPLLRRHGGFQHGDANALARENVRQACSDVALLSISGEDVAAAAARLQFGLYDLDQSPFLGIHELLIQILRLGDQELFAALRYGIILVAIKIPDVPGMTWCGCSRCRSIASSRNALKGQ